MKPRKKVRRPRERTAHEFEGLPGLVAFYADALGHSMIEGYGAPARGRPNYVSAFGTIETKVRRPADRPVVFDARAVLGAPARVVREDGRERCVVTIALPNGKTLLIGLDAPCHVIEDAIRKARR